MIRPNEYYIFWLNDGSALWGLVDNNIVQQGIVHIVFVHRLNKEMENAGNEHLSDELGFDEWIEGVVQRNGVLVPLNSIVRAVQLTEQDLFRSTGGEVLRLAFTKDWNKIYKQQREIVKKEQNANS